MIHRLPSLQFLDSTPVTADERAEAERVGKFMKVAMPDPAQVRLILGCPRLVLSCISRSR